MAAVDVGNLDMVKLLLKNGAAKEHKSKVNDTAHSLACEKREKAASKELKEKYALIRDLVKI